VEGSLGRGVGKNESLASNMITRRGTSRKRFADFGNVRTSILIRHDGGRILSTVPH
jgi:hypothetical protein